MMPDTPMTPEQERDLRRIAGKGGPLHPEAWETHRALCLALDALTDERRAHGETLTKGLGYKMLAEDFKAECERLKAWVDDLQSGMYINCVYCGHRYGPDSEVPASMADVLKEHIEQCREHPMSKLKARVEWFERERRYCGHQPVSRSCWCNESATDDTQPTKEGRDG